MCIRDRVNVPEFDLNEPCTLNQDQEISEKSKEALNQMWRNGCINDTYAVSYTHLTVLM